MQTLGIDLSTDPKKVWTCEIDWSESPPRIVSLERLSTVADPLGGHAPGGADGTLGSSPNTGYRSKQHLVRSEASLIAALVERIVTFEPSAERVVGVDAPLGWPTAFVEAISDWDDGDVQGFRKRPDLRLRATDRFVHAVSRLTPMSVSTDRMGSTTMLLAEVLSRSARRLDRQAFERASGRDGIAEVHPAAALRSWTDGAGQEISTTAYKSWDVPRATIVIKIVRAGFELSPEQALALIGSDDALDAFICALVARAVVRGTCATPADPVDVQQLLPRQSQLGRGDSVEQIAERLDLARSLQVEAQRTSGSEGWIQVPKRDALASSIGTTPGSASWEPASRLEPMPYRADWLDDDWDERDDDDHAHDRAASGFGELQPGDWDAVERMRADDDSESEVWSVYDERSMRGSGGGRRY